MTTHHGDPMPVPEATWTKVPAYAAKNKELQAKTSKENEKITKSKRRKTRTKQTALEPMCHGASNATMLLGSTLR